MNKFKKIMLGALSALTLGLFVAVGTNVDAASHDIGSATVTTTTNSGDTKTWDFKVSSAKTLANGDDVNGVVVYGGYNKGSAGTPSVKKDNGGLDFYLHGYVLVPVVSENSEGTISVMLTSNSGGRYIDLISNSGTVTSSVLTSKTDTMDYTFTEDDVWTINEKYYVKLWSEVYTGNPLTPSGDANSSNSGEIKMGTVSVVLSNGTYGEAATLYTVTYMDGTTTLKTDAEAVDGSNITYTPKKYGYDFEGWYTESTLDNKISISYTVTDDVTLYANWTTWTNTGIEEYTLSNAAIGKIATGIEGSLSADLLLTPSIYTAMTGVSMTTTSVTLPGASSATQAPCFNTGGALSTSQRGIKFTAPANGTFVAYVGSGGTGTSRSVVFNTGSGSINPTEGESTLEFDGTSYEPRQFTFEVEEGTTYYLGGTNGVRIYYVSFEEVTTLADNTTAAVFAEKNTAGDTLRFVGTLTGITDLANIDSIELILEKDGVATKKQIFLTTCYISVTGSSQECPEATNTYYVIYRITGITGVTGTISKQLKVTFTDGSYTLSAATEFDL